MRSASILAAIAILAGWASHATAGEWMLMAREGGCVTIAEAAERQPVLDGISTPDELVERIREQGEGVSRNDIPFTNGVNVVVVEAPGLDLGLVFAPPTACR